VQRFMMMIMTSSHFSVASLWTTAVIAIALLGVRTAFGATPAELLARYQQLTGTPADPSRGQQFFTASHGRQWRCSSCHGSVPLDDGRHAVTGKVIAPLAPAADPRRLTDVAKVEKWLGRNCQDVVGRSCTPVEKADVLAFLAGLRK
jgi:hypothetical protein